MPANITIERVLRDADDASGQTVRDWKIEADNNGFIWIGMKNGTGVVSVRPEDFALFVADLEVARESASNLVKDKQ